MSSGKKYGKRSPSDRFTNHDRKRLKFQSGKDFCFFCDRKTGKNLYPSNMITQTLSICPYCVKSEKNFLDKYGICMNPKTKVANNGVLRVSPNAELYDTMLQYKIALKAFNAPEEKEIKEGKDPLWDPSYKTRLDYLESCKGDQKDW